MATITTGTTVQLNPPRIELLVDIDDKVKAATAIKERRLIDAVKEDNQDDYRRYSKIDIVGAIQQVIGRFVMVAQVNNYESVSIYCDREADFVAVFKGKGKLTVGAVLNKRTLNYSFHS